jgi:hypothetical protein
MPTAKTLTAETLEELAAAYEAAGGFEHGTVTTGFGQCGGEVLGQYASEYHEALGAPLIAECSLDKFVDGPVGVIEEVTHARFLCERVALGNAVRV